jgi:hypothetical protein
LRWMKWTFSAGWDSNWLLGNKWSLLPNQFSLPGCLSNSCQHSISVFSESFYSSMKQEGMHNYNILYTSATSLWVIVGKQWESLSAMFWFNWTGTVNREGRV